MIKGDQIVPYSALYIDMQYRHLFNTLWAYLKPVDQNKYIQEIEEIWLGGLKNQKILITLCVRASTDLVLQALNWPPGSEVIITGINIPDMIQVLRLNGIIPVPVEVNADTLGCTLDQFKQFYTHKTKGIMISYVFGAKFDASEIIDWAKSKGLFIMEDEAESFVAPNAKLNPNVDFSTFSFGSIKTCSAFGGSISVIRNNEALYRKMKALQESYPKWSQKNYFKRTLKNLIPMILLNSQKINRSSRWIFINLFPNWDYKEFVVNSIRGFQKNSSDVLQTYRFRVPDPMLVMLALRMKTFDVDQFNMATQRQIVGQSILKKGGLIVPGHAVEERKFWLYPVVVPNPETTYKILNARGIDAYMGVTQLDIVESPIGSSYQYPNKTLSYFKNILYLPIHQNADLKSIQTICKEVLEVVDMLKNRNPKL
ncbi:unnamed protein product [Paramecium pentaurelia]|uniref:DegT/DnrJ/EryC1/StrS aminotransferase family protein n=1 Tax=Paramecium pentaurelia TaxID=43138 RepID=A0A8S1VB46_9CILI|nr:unnamed protein product [Paramecium pentaurelia]